jgi:hypothetical protein
MTEYLKEFRVDPYDNTKKVMHLLKEFLVPNNQINVVCNTNSAGNGAKAVESLCKLGYIAYDNIKTETNIDNNRRKTRLIITVHKTKDFDKLYKENEEKRKQLEEQKKKESNNEGETNK